MLRAGNREPDPGASYRQPRCGSRLRSVGSLIDRFEALVDRSADHHLWLGAVDRQHTPQIRVDGRLTTARRVAWQLAHGPIPPGARIAACPAHPRCVRTDHLHLGSRPRAPQLSPPIAVRRRAPHGSGTAREVRHGVWKLTVTMPGGGRINRTIYGNADHARQRLAVFAVEQRGGARTLDLLVAAHHAQLVDRGLASVTLRRYEQLWRQWLSPTLGRIHPEQLTRTDVERVLVAMAAAGQSPSSIRQAAIVIAAATQWANERGDLPHNSTNGAHLPNGTRLTTPRHRS
jgi:hypothetical protein